MGKGRDGSPSPKACKVEPGDCGFEKAGGVKGKASDGDQYVFPCPATHRPRTDAVVGLGWSDHFSSLLLSASPLATAVELALLGAFLPFPQAPHRRPYSTTRSTQPPRDSHSWRSSVAEVRAARRRRLPAGLGLPRRAPGRGRLDAALGARALLLGRDGAHPPLQLLPRGLLLRLPPVSYAAAA